MKTKILIGVLGAGVAIAALLPRFAGAQPTIPLKNGVVESPLGQECVVTVQLWSAPVTLPGQTQPSGFQPDATLRGKVIGWGSDWVVLKDGSYENWVSRDKVLSVRVSR